MIPNIPLTGVIN